MTAAEKHIAERLSPNRLTVIWSTPKFHPDDWELEEALIKLGLGLPATNETKPYEQGNFNRELDRLRLSELTEKHLIDNGIMTIEELCRRSRKELKGLRNVGETTIKKIQQALESLGLSLAEGKKPSAHTRKPHKTFRW